MRVATVLPLLLTGILSAHAQSSKVDPAFDVASIKVSPPREGRGFVGITGGPGSEDPRHAVFVRYRLRGLVTYAYGLKIHQWNGVDASLLQNEFDVHVSVPEGATREQLPAMMRTLLAERFHLRVHTEKKDADVYLLVQAKKGHKLKPSVISGDTTPLVDARKDAKSVPKIPPGLSTSVCSTAVCRMQQVGKTLAPVIAQIAAELEAPVRDATGLTGKFDYVLSWALPVSLRELPDDAPPPLRTAITEQLGLRLEQRNGAEEVLIIDSVDPRPTEN
jgi:uncharacterized protein (TIGR03435 family)